LRTNEQESIALSTRGLLTRLIAPTLLIVLLNIVTVSAAGKLPADKAGDIGKAEGKIAFNRTGDVWVMDASGDNQEKICEVANADGRMSWRPNGRQIVFTRSGVVDLKAPDYMGGRHKIYDVFVADLDSAYHNNRLFWRRLTSELGGRDPEWSYDGGTIYFFQDMNANVVSADRPNYQLCTVDPESSKIKVMRNDWETASDVMLMSPSVNREGSIACVAFFELKPQGLVVLSPGQVTLPADSLKALAQKNLSKVAPSWSPDGKWVAYVYNDLNNPGVYITNPDLTEDYLVFTPPVGTYLYTEAPSFSPNSKWLTFATTDGSVWICPITGEGPRRLSGPGSDHSPAWSKPPTK
jgi:Tol biopolymer transport system component